MIWLKSDFIIKALVFDPANEDEEEHLRDFHKVAKLAEKKIAGRDFEWAWILYKSNY